MELQYDTPLVIKKYRSVALTEAGRCLVEAARSMTRDLDAAGQRIEAIARGRFEGNLVIGADPATNSSDLRRYVAKLMTSFPGARVSVRQTRWAQMADAFLSRQLDLYVGPRPDGAQEDLDFSRASCPPAVLLCRVGHPLLENGRNWIEWSHEFPLIGPHLPHRLLKSVANRISSLEFTNWLARTEFVVVEHSSIIAEMVGVTDSIGLVFGSYAEGDATNVSELIRVEFPIFDPAFVVGCRRRECQQLPIARFVAIAAQSP
jgi:DNA-binding transcriptional LysR family regulator